MTDFIREVDEDLRQEKVKRALSRYWYLIAGLVVLILGGVGAWKAYDYLRSQKAEAASARYLDALDLDRTGKADEAVAALQGLQGDGTSGYRLLARFRLAGATGAKDAAAGAKLFDDLAADPGVDPAMQAVAKLRAGLLLLDKLPYPELRQRLDLLADANSPVRNAAREMVALGALKAGKIDEAARAFDAIEADPLATASQHQRIEALQGLVRGAGEVPVPPVAPPPAPVSTPPAASVPPPAVAADPVLPAADPTPPLVGDPVPAAAAPSPPAAPDPAK